MFDFLNGPVRELVTQIYEAVGYLGVALWVAIESVIIPIPSELVLPFAGFLIGEGAATEPLTGSPWNYWLTVLAGTLGATVGALIAYGIGAWGGRPILERWGRWLGITADDLDRADAFFAKHGEADLGHTLNRLTIAGTPLRVIGGDQLEEDLFFRFNQSFQAYFDASARVATDTWDASTPARTSSRVWAGSTPITVSPA